jgi:ubiquinone/menaquinone biosynthesis C-methylase UbiE
MSTGAAHHTADLVHADDNMMEYEDYTATSQTYDNIRLPIGLDSLHKALLTSQKNTGAQTLGEMSVLDVGCGTGNYIGAVKSKVGRSFGLEFNEGMLAQSKEKHSGDARVDLRHGSVLDMSCFADASFDTVFMTQVIHHLTPDMHGQALSEMARVLKPGGTLWIQTQTPHQHMEGFWWTPLIPQAAAVLAARFPSLPLFQRQLSVAGMALTAVDVPAAPLVQLDAYLELEGPFSQIYRNADSTWSLASEQELEVGLAWWRGQIDAGTAADFVERREATRQQVGQTTCVTSVKPLNMTDTMKEAVDNASLPPINIEPFPSA